MAGARTDALMPRTAGSPAAGRASGERAKCWPSALRRILLGLVLSRVAGELSTPRWWAWLRGCSTSGSTRRSRRRTTANTAVGAVAGALPVLMGWTAAGAPLGLEAATLFLIVYLWQFPHFMAIAWLYRQRLRRGRTADAHRRRSHRPPRRACRPWWRRWPCCRSACCRRCCIWRGVAVFARSACSWASVNSPLPLAFLRRSDEASARLLLRASLGLSCRRCWLLLMLAQVDVSEDTLWIHTQSRSTTRRSCRPRDMATPPSSLQYQPALPLVQRQADHLAVPVDGDHVLRRADRHVHRAPLRRADLAHPARGAPERADRRVQHVRADLLQRHRRAVPRGGQGEQAGRGQGLDGRSRSCWAACSWA